MSRQNEPSESTCKSPPRFIIDGFPRNQDNLEVLSMLLSFVSGITAFYMGAGKWRGAPCPIIFLFRVVFSGNLRRAPRTFRWFRFFKVYMHIIMGLFKRLSGLIWLYSVTRASSVRNFWKTLLFIFKNFETFASFALSKKVTLPPICPTVTPPSLPHLSRSVARTRLISGRPSGE